MKVRDNSWQILWFLLYLDPVYESDRRKLEDVLDCVEGGCSSPVIYFEMCSALNTSAGALREITPAIIRCLHWGCENEFLSKELALRYVYLAGRSKEFNKVVLERYDKYICEIFLMTKCLQEYAECI